MCSSEAPASSRQTPSRSCQWAQKLHTDGGSISYVLANTVIFKHTMLLLHGIHRLDASLRYLSHRHLSKYLLARKKGLAERSE